MRAAQVTSLTGPAGVEVRDIDELDEDRDSDSFENRIDSDDDGDLIPTADEEPESNNGNPLDDDWDNDGTPDFLDAAERAAG